IPILALDMYEHAYHIDFGANATAYIDAFHRNIDWVSTQTRYEDAAGAVGPRPLVQKEFGDLPGVAVEEVKAMLDSESGSSSAMPAQGLISRDSRTSWTARYGVTRSGSTNGSGSCRNPTRS